MRLIDADNLREGIACHKQYTDQEYETDRQWALGYNAGIERALFSITYAPTIDAEPVRHGRWEEGAFENSKRCSVCQKYATKVHCHSELIFDYERCPYCGAKMDKGAE